jgi:hypothetical protein
MLTLQSRQPIQLRLDGGQLITQREREKGSGRATLPVVRSNLTPPAQQAILVTGFATQIMQALAELRDTHGSAQAVKAGKIGVDQFDGAKFSCR